MMLSTINCSGAFHLSAEKLRLCCVELFSLAIKHSKVLQLRAIGYILIISNNKSTKLLTYIIASNSQ